MVDFRAWARENVGKTIAAAVVAGGTVIGTIFWRNVATWPVWFAESWETPRWLVLLLVFNQANSPRVGETRI
jgi:hypothetical protein